MGAGSDHYVSSAKASSSKISAPGAVASAEQSFHEDQFRIRITKEGKGYTKKLKIISDKNPPVLV